MHAVALICLLSQCCIALLFCVEEVIKKALSLTGEIFFGGGAEMPSSAWPNFFQLIFGQRTKFGSGG